MVMTSFVLAVPSIESIHASASSSANLCASLFRQVPYTLHVSNCGREVNLVTRNGMSFGQLLGVMTINGVELFPNSMS